MTSGPETMNCTTLLFPIRQDATDELEKFAARIMGPDAALFDRSQRRVGISKEYWFLHDTPAGKLVVFYVEADDVAKALGAFVASQEPDDLMLKDQVRKLTGVNIARVPAASFPRILLQYPP